MRLGTEGPLHVCMQEPSGPQDQFRPSSGWRRGGAGLVRSADGGQHGAHASGDHKRRVFSGGGLVVERAGERQRQGRVAAGGARTRAKHSHTSKIFPRHNAPLHYEPRPGTPSASLTCRDERFELSLLYPMALLRLACFRGESITPVTSGIRCTLGRQALLDLNPHCIILKSC